MNHRIRFPRVARSSQPWADGWNPVGILPAASPEKQKVSADQIVSSALAAQVSAHATRKSAASRDRRVHWPKVNEILSRVPEVPTLPGDEV